MTSIKPSPNFSRSSRSRFQTKTLPARNGQRISPSLLESRSSSLPRNVPKYRVDVPSVRRLARANRVGVVDSVGLGQPEKGSQPSAPSVMSILWYGSFSEVPGRSTVAIVSAPRHKKEEPP